MKYILVCAGGRYLFYSNHNTHKHTHKHTHKLNMNSQASLTMSVTLTLIFLVFTSASSSSLFHFPCPIIVHVSNSIGFFKHENSNLLNWLSSNNLFSSAVFARNSFGSTPFAVITLLLYRYKSSCTIDGNFS